MDFTAVGPRPDGYYIQNHLGTVAIVNIQWPQPWIANEEEFANFIAEQTNKFIAEKSALHQNKET